MNPLRLFLFGSDANPKLIEFRAPLTSLTGNVDQVNGIIRNVSLITSGVTAKGHDLEIDDTTLEQLLGAAQTKNQIPVKLDHGSGVAAVCGYVTNFHIDGVHLRGDWHLLKSHKEYATTLEKAQVMPQCFGLSAAFLGSAQTTKAGGGKASKAARCTELLSVDCVTTPAANPGGLFEARPGQVVSFDTPAEDIMPAEPTLTDVLAQLTSLGNRFAAIETSVADLQNAPTADGELTAEDLNAYAAMSDQELAAEGLTRAQVNTAISQWNAQVEAEASTEDDGTADDTDTDAPAGSGAAAPAGAATATAGAGATSLSSKDPAIQFLLSRAVAEDQRIEAAEAQQVMHAFGVMETKVTELGTLVRGQEQTITALRNQIALGNGGELAASHPENLLFSAKEGLPTGSFEALVADEVVNLQAKNPGLAELSAKSQAIDIVRRRNPAALNAYRRRGGKIAL